MSSLVQLEPWVLTSTLRVCGIHALYNSHLSVPWRPPEAASAVSSRDRFLYRSFTRAFHLVVDAAINGESLPFFWYPPAVLSLVVVVGFVLLWRRCRYRLMWWCLGAASCFSPDNDHAMRREAPKMSSDSLVRYIDGIGHSVRSSGTSGHQQLDDEPMMWSPFFRNIAIHRPGARIRYRAVLQMQGCYHFPSVLFYRVFYRLSVLTEQLILSDGYMNGSIIHTPQRDI